jgi:hypothetical protein
MSGVGWLLIVHVPFVGSAPTRAGQLNQSLSTIISLLRPLAVVDAQPSTGNDLDASLHFPLSLSLSLRDY